MESIAWRAAFNKLSHGNNKKRGSTADIDNNAGPGTPAASLHSRQVSLLYSISF